MLCLDKEKAIALACSWSSRLFVFMFIYPETSAVCSYPAAPFTLTSLRTFKTQDWSRTTVVWCQSAKLPGKLAVKNLAQGHLNRKKACLVCFLLWDFPRSSGQDFEFFPRADAPAIFHLPFSSSLFCVVWFSSTTNRRSQDLKEEKCRRGFASVWNFSYFFILFCIHSHD